MSASPESRSSASTTFLNAASSSVPYSLARHGAGSGQ
jgi:hypothetical protein